jgi:hypothetical protein
LGSIEIETRPVKSKGSSELPPHEYSDSDFDYDVDVDEEEEESSEGSSSDEDDDMDGTFREEETSQEK